MEGGLNTFGYVGGNPYGYVDPYGLAKVVIDPGHGDIYNKFLDPGAYVSGTGEMEKDYALQLALDIGGRLKELGHDVVYTRKCDLDDKKRERLKWRSDISNAEKADLFISIHLNSASNQNANYFMVGYMSSKGKAVAQAVAGAVKQSGYSKSVAEYHKYKVIKNTVAPAILIEAGFITNPNNAIILADPEFLDQLTNGLVSGLNNCKC